jgi:putative ATP-binding cassette transporter
MRALLWFVWREGFWLFLAALGTGVLSGAANAAVLAVVYKSLSPGAHQINELRIAFAVLIVVAPALNVASQLLAIKLGHVAGTRLSMRLVMHVLQAPLRVIEEIGPSSLLALLTEDLAVVVNALLRSRDICLNSAVLAGCLVLLGSMSWQLLAATACVAAIGWAAYWKAQVRADSYLRDASGNTDDLFRHYRTLTSGAKELKLHARRRSSFLSSVLKPAFAKLHSNRFQGLAIYSAAASSFYLLWFMFLGAVVFVLPNLRPVSATFIAGSALLLIYVVGPLAAITSSLPDMARAGIALQRIDRVAVELTEQSDWGLEGDRPLYQRSWQTLELDHVAHRYSHNGDRSFRLGPLNLTIRRGDLLFITGGNGSGKSTLAKILGGLYVPDSGTVRLDGQAITRENIDKYRNMFTIIFSDCYLFDRLLGLESSDPTAIDSLLRDLRLSHVVQVNHGVFSTINVSHGQQKRLALLTAILEDRPIYVFDEWAADQDPSFRELFYRMFLPRLHERGKTVIVITHDDAYYHVAKRLIKLEEGRIAYDSVQSAANIGEPVDRYA